MSKRPAQRSDVLPVIASVLAAMVLYPLMIAPGWGGRITGLHAVALVLTFGVVALAQLWCRRRPGAALAVGSVAALVDAALGPSLAVWLAFADIVYAATLHGRPALSRRMVPLASAVAVLLVLASMLLSLTWHDGLAGALGIVPLMLVPVAWAHSVRHHQEMAEAERRSAQQGARIAELDRNAAVQGERARIARDLHDVVAGHISSIAVQAEAATRSSPPPSPATGDVLRQMRSESIRALREMRSMIDVLAAGGESVADDSAPGSLADLPLLAASARASGLEVELRADSPPAGEVPAGVELAAYRIVQEALVNAAKHASGAQVTVGVDVGDDAVTLEVVNDIPATVARTDADALVGGRGLITMRERAAALGGTFVASPSGDRWWLRAELPRGVATPTSLASPTAHTAPTSPS